MFYFKSIVSVMPDLDSLHLCCRLNDDYRIIVPGKADSKITKK